jgi:hypothetical protein
LIANRIDRVIETCKWPAAFAAVVATPFLLWATFRLVRSIFTLETPWNSSTFALGIVLFVFLWRSYLGQTKLGQWLVHLEHELTHTLFAAATLHPIVDFRATVQEGSQVQFRGQGNWLITVAPYFFPTAAIVLWIPSLFVPLSGLIWTNLALGMAAGYHIVSSIKETHSQQDDLRQLGWRFCWMFLPAANLLGLGMLVAFSQNGLTGIGRFVGYALEPGVKLIQFLLG